MLERARPSRRCRKLTLPPNERFVRVEEMGTDRRRTRCTMNDVPIGHAGIRERAPQTRNATGELTPTRTTRALGLGAVAFGAFALGATAIGALAIGSLAVGALALKRGRVRTLTVDTLEVRRLHIGELTIDSGLPR